MNTADLIASNAVLLMRELGVSDGNAARAMMKAITVIAKQNNPNNVEAWITAAGAGALPDQMKGK